MSSAREAATSEGGATVFTFDDIPWQVADRPDPVEGFRGKRLAQGEGGFYVQHVQMPPGHEVTPHSHSETEVIVILEGGCELGAERTKLERHDSAVLHANHTYGFTVGSEGMQFLIIRTGEAQLTRADTTTTN